MAADYTDGGGWAKLDQTAADGLATVAETFPAAKRGKYFRMLLTLYSATGRDGCVTIGRRTLAERAGVHEESARRFLAKLENDGFLVPAGERVTQHGTFPMRRWEWLVDGGGSKNRPTPGSKSPGKSTEGGSKSPRKSTHIRCHKQMIAGGSAAAAPPPENIQMFGPNVPGLGMRTD